MNIIAGIFKKDGFDFEEVKEAVQADLALLGCTASDFELTEEDTQISEILKVWNKHLYLLSYRVSGNIIDSMIQGSLYIVSQYKLRTFDIHGIRDADYFKQYRRT